MSSARPTLDVGEEWFDAPEQAASGDIPERYARVLAVEVRGDQTTLWLLTNDAPPLEGYTVWCTRNDGLWAGRAVRRFPYSDTRGRQGRRPPASNSPLRLSEKAQQSSASGHRADPPSDKRPAEPLLALPDEKVVKCPQPQQARGHSRRAIALRYSPARKAAVASWRSGLPDRGGPVPLGGLRTMSRRAGPGR